MRRLILIIFILLEFSSLLAGPQYAKIRYSIVTVDFTKLSWKTITVGDGTSSDWKGALPTKENSYVYSSNEYIWYDAFGDDVGDGDYTYPTTNTVFNPSSADIYQFRVCWDSTNIYFYIRMYNAPADWWAGAVIIAIDTGTPDGGCYDFIEGDGVDPDKGCAVELRCEVIKFDYFLFAASTYRARLWNWKGEKIGDADDPDQSDGTFDNIKFKAPVWEEYEIKVPQSLIGTPSIEPWHFIVGAGFEENQLFRETQGYPLLTAWYFTGGDPIWWDNTSPDPDVCDLIGAPLDKQIEDLASYFNLFVESQSNIESLNVGITPNLFNPEQQQSIIYFSVPVECKITVKILKLDGREIAELFDNDLSPQEGNDLYELMWDGRDSSGEILGSGIYILYLRFKSKNQKRDIYKYFKIWR